VKGKRSNGETEIVLNWITPHQKWGIHSTYSDNLLMLTLSRGGPIVAQETTPSAPASRTTTGSSASTSTAPDRPCGGQPARQGRHGDDVPRPGTHRERAGFGDHRTRGGITTR
jgi:hypothetical protein